MTTPWLDPEQERVWRAYRRMFTLLEATLGSELAESGGLSMADYTVLSNLVDVEDRRWRITALADHIRWSQSRLSHQIRRMEERGLVRRQQVDDDGRGAYVELTREGLRAIAAATPIHLGGVRRHMIDLLTPEQLGALGEIADTVLAHIKDEPGTPRR